MLVGVQAQLGFMAGDLPALGALHGLNALLLFAAALHTALRVAGAADPAVAAPAAEPAAATTV